MQTIRENRIYTPSPNSSGLPYFKTSVWNHNCHAERSDSIPENHKWTKDLNASTETIPSSLNVDDSKLGVIIEKFKKGSDQRKVGNSIGANWVTLTDKQQRKAGTWLEKVLILQEDVVEKKGCCIQSQESLVFTQGKLLNFPWLYFLAVKIKTNIIILIIGLQGRFSLHICALLQWAYLRLNKWKMLF